MAECRFLSQLGLSGFVQSRKPDQLKKTGSQRAGEKEWAVKTVKTESGEVRAEAWKRIEELAFKLGN